MSLHPRPTDGKHAGATKAPDPGPRPAVHRRYFITQEEADENRQKLGAVADKFYLGDRIGFGRVPQELRDRPQWVVWRYALTKDGSKWTKVPYQALCHRRKASSTNPATWATFEQAEKTFYAFRKADERDKLDGIGYVFSAEDPYVGIDFDRSVHLGAGVKQWAFGLLDQLKSYTELSPSGSGVKVIVRGKLPGPGNKKTGLGEDGDGAVEMYDRGRFFTITSERADRWGKVIADRTEMVAQIHAAMFPPKPKPEPKPRKAAGKPPEALPDDDKLVELARRYNPAFGPLFDRGDTSANNGDDSAADFALCTLLAYWFGGDEAAVDRVFRRSALMREKWDERRGATTYGALTVANAVAKQDKVYEPRAPQAAPEPEPKAKPEPAPEPAGAGDKASAPARPPKRPEIEVNTERHRVLAEALAVLPTDPDLFCRGNVLVRVAREQEDVAKLPGGVRLRKAKGGVRVVMVGEAGLSCRLTALADFYSWFTKNGEDTAKAVHPPGWLVGAVAENGVYPGVRPLEGLAEVPFPRPDGTLVTGPGYDATTGIFYAPSVAVGPIPESPTKADAEAAAGRLLAVVQQFPFAADGDRAVFLAALLTAAARPAVEGPVPGVAFNGNKAGTGKGKLIDAVAVALTGRPTPTTTYPRDEAEADKLKVAFALAATPIVHLDNIEEGRTYGGGVLDSALTSMFVSGRILGQSKTTEGLELRCCWFLSGNNISPAKDAFRRWLVCNLVTDLERPEERRDLKIPDLLGYVRGHRADLVRDALVVLRAHAVAGRPAGDWAPLGSFEQWDKVVRGAVWYATGWDCNSTRRKASEESPDRLNKLALLEAWNELPNGGQDGTGVTSEEAHRFAFGDKDTPARYPGLGEALVRFSRDGKVPPRTIGYVIRGMKGQNINGMAFRHAGENSRRSTLWRVEKLGPSQNRQSGDAGDAGDVSSYPSARNGYNHDVYSCGYSPTAHQDGYRTSPASPASPDEDREEFVL